MLELYLPFLKVISNSNCLFASWLSEFRAIDALSVNIKYLLCNHVCRCADTGVCSLITDDRRQREGDDSELAFEYQSVLMKAELHLCKGHLTHP